MVQPTHCIWNISKLHCKHSVAWYTLQTIFGRSLIPTMYFLCHGSPDEPYLASLCNLHSESFVILLNLYGF